MTDYTELIRSLRNCSNNRCAPCDCEWFDKYQVDESCKEIIMWKAAAAIEALQAQLDEANKTADKWEMEHDAIYDIARIIILQRKCATIPEDGYYELKDGHMHKLEQQLPKRGEWVEDATTYAGPGLSNYKCSLCGKICGTWRRGLEPSELPNWCGNCGADMRKKEVQDGE